MATLWSAPAALTAAAVRTQLANAVSYSTVVTILSRLHAKGLLSREPAGRAYAYRPVADESGLAARRMRQVLDGEPDRHRVLARFVSDLNDEDERLLRSLLRTSASPPPELAPSAARGRAEHRDGKEDAE